MTNTRIKLTWYAVIALTMLTGFAIVKNMDGVAAAGIGGILTVVTGYQTSRAFTKSTAMKNNTEDKP